MADISKNSASFIDLSYTLSALPIISHLKLDGFASDGVEWDDIEPASVKIGADGLAIRNYKPVLYVGTFKLAPNSNARQVLDNLILKITPEWGKSLVNYSLSLSETNATTGYTVTYSDGVITAVSGGNSANYDDGQGERTYKMTFSARTALPV